ncbi:MAG: DUF4837 family protein [Bacteroidetes bacterium]|nr:DUF4837 family protein [Bacteroidota bacterium]
MFTTKSTTYLLCLITICISACKSSEKNKLENSVGKLGTLTIVSNKETHTELQNTYNNIFLGQENKNLSAPFNEVLQPDEADFFKFFYNQRTILVMVTEDNYNNLDDLVTEFKKEDILNYINSAPLIIKSSKNLFSKNQEILYLFGKNTQDLKYKLEQNSFEIINLLLKNELNAQINALQNDTSVNAKYYNEIKSNFGVGVQIPSGFMLKKQTPNFFFFQMTDKSDANKPKEIGLMIHAYKYKDTTDFSYLNIRTQRDSLCKYNMPGEIAGTYMSTSESEEYPARQRQDLMLNGYKTTKVSAWWTVKGISMAGPFTRYIVYVPKKNSIFAFEGFINKANLDINDKDIRLIEAIAQSIK